MFYQRLEKLCQEEGVKITPLIKSLGMSASGIERWRNGIMPSGDTLIKFSEYFNVTTDYLLGVTDDPSSPNENKKPQAQRLEVEKVFDELVKHGFDTPEKVRELITAVEAIKKIK